MRMLLAAALLASLQGVVTDPSGSAVPKTAITVLKGESVVATAESDNRGRYQINSLAPGTYVVRAFAPGFAPFEASLEVAAGRGQTLDIALVLRVESVKIRVNDTAKGVDTDAASNAGATVLRGKDLDALPDDRDDLATDLQALAGPAAGPNGGQIFIDGFTGGRLPSKQSIREVRINQNPFAAQFDRPGHGRIEIFTKPGTDEFHGNLLFQFSDATFNSRNPFVTVKPPYQRRQWEGEFSGPLGKKTSFFSDFEFRNVDENAFVNALTPDGSLKEAVVTPIASVEANFKVDRQLSTNHTLSARYTYAHDANDNQGVGGFSLPSRAYQDHIAESTLQVTETGVLSTHVINETRFRFRRQRDNLSGGSVGPTLHVADAFTSGGSNVGVSFNNQDRYELQNFTSLVKGKHVIRWGGIMRGVSLSDRSMQNYAGTFTFTSLDNYRLTLLGQQKASQFSIAGGNPLAELQQFDFGWFVQDDWRLRPNFTLNGGLRYETQTHAHDWSDFGPRLGFAWALGDSKGKTPKTVVRGGFGIFYDRLKESLSLDALRQDGVHQQQFLIPFPDFYPAIPSLQSLAGNKQPQAIRETDAHWSAPMMMQGAMGLERQLPKGVTVSSSYIHSRGVHALHSRNINAPLPASGIYPYGGVNSIYLYETNGVFRQHQWITNVNARINAKIAFSGFYAWGQAKSNTDGAGTFPADQYDLSSEYGRAGFDIRHRLQFNGSAQTRWGMRFSPFLTLASGRPYNITIGRDLNGDSLYTDRPFQSNGKTIPRNYGSGPGQIAANMRVSKTFTFGEHGNKKPARDPRELVVTITARNILNHPNLASPVGNLSSLLFGQSTSLAGGGGTTGTRRLDLQVRFNF